MMNQHIFIKFLCLNLIKIDYQVKKDIFVWKPEKHPKREL